MMHIDVLMLRNKFELNTTKYFSSYELFLIEPILTMKYLIPAVVYIMRQKDIMYIEMRFEIT